MKRCFTRIRRRKRSLKRNRSLANHSCGDKTTFSESSSDDTRDVPVLHLNTVFRDDVSSMNDSRLYCQEYSNKKDVIDFAKLLRIIGDDDQQSSVVQDEGINARYPVDQVTESPKYFTSNDNESVETLLVGNATSKKKNGLLTSFLYLSLVPTHQDPHDKFKREDSSLDQSLCLNTLALTPRDIVISSLQANIRMHSTEWETKKAWTKRETLPVQVDDVTLLVCQDDPLTTVDKVVQGILIRQEYHIGIELYESLRKDAIKRQTQSDIIRPLLIRLAILSLLAGKEKKAQKYFLSLVECSDAKNFENMEALILAGLIQLGCNQLREAHSTWREAAYKVGKNDEYKALLWNNMACLKTLLGSTEEAIESIQQSLQLQKEASRSAYDAKQSTLNMSITLSNCAVISEYDQDYNRAAAKFRESLLLQESVLSAQNYFFRVTKQHFERVIKMERYGSGRPDSLKNTKIREEYLFDVSGRSPLPCTIYDVGGTADLIQMGPLLNEFNSVERVKESFIKALDSHQKETRNPSSKSLRNNGRSKLPVDIDTNKIIDAELKITRIYSDVTKFLINNEVGAALDLLKCSLKSHLDNYGIYHPLIASTLHNIGVVLVFADRYGAALLYFEHASRIRVSTLGCNHPEVAASLMKVGLLQVASGDFDTALETFTQILLSLRKSLGYNHPQIVKVLNNIACVHLMCGGGVAATKSMEEGIEILRSLLAKDCEASLALSFLLSNHGFILSKRDLNCDATKAYDEARNLQKSLYPANHPVLGSTTVNLGHTMSLDRLRRQKELHGFLNFMEPLQCT